MLKLNKLYHLTFIIHLNVYDILKLERKRSGPPMAVPVPSKKPKHHASSSHSSFAWEQMCIEVDSIDFLDSLSYSIQNQENLKAVSNVFYILLYIITL